MVPFLLFGLSSGAAGPDATADYVIEVAADDVVIQVAPDDETLEV